MASQISVVIPAYNASRVIERQLRALNAQSRLDFDVVVSDNGSTDETGRVVANWAPAFASLRYVDSSGLKGAAHARNVGVRAVRSEFVLLCDSDDVVSPVWVSAHVAALEHADASSGPLHIVEEPGTLPREIWNECELPVSMSFLPYLPSGNAGFRREAFEQLDGFDEDLWRGHEDVDLGWRLSLAGFSVRHTPDAVIEYVQRSTRWKRVQQQFSYGQAFAELYAKHEAEQIPVQSQAWRVKWWLEWTKQTVPNSQKWSSALNTLAFQVGRGFRSTRLGVRSPMW
ncbi:glycosyltransferase family 2 protein [Pseudoclavibacter sp. JSM 162008]|uniref:glycosyltransferase family 2 protein n=1 Tax=Pseudoclavibacter sp. JSM 162008 TaxID=3229855 RepID=UPI003525C4D6